MPAKKINITGLLSLIKKELRKYASPSKAKILQRFFKTGPGEYGEGDVFIGVVVPHIRKISQKFSHLPLSSCIQLFSSSVHEERLLALLLLVLQFEETSDEEKRKKLFNAYLANTRYVNNWDLVDLTAHHIVGAYLVNKDKKILFRLCNSASLWERRIAMIAVFYYIRNNSFDTALQVAELLVNDTEDLIQKAVGWMLREIGKRDLTVEEQFLKKHYKTMPRTMLRYAIEKFPEQKRQWYLDKGSSACKQRGHPPKIHRRMTPL